MNQTAPPPPKPPPPKPRPHDPGHSLPNGKWPFCFHPTPARICSRDISLCLEVNRECLRDTPLCLRVNRECLRDSPLCLRVKSERLRDTPLRLRDKSGTQAQRHFTSPLACMGPHIASLLAWGMADATSPLSVKRSARQRHHESQSGFLRGGTPGSGIPKGARLYP